MKVNYLYNISRFNYILILTELFNPNSRKALLEYLVKGTKPYLDLQPTH